MGQYFNARVRLHRATEEPRYVTVEDPLKAYEIKRQGRRCGHIIGLPDESQRWRICDELDPCLWHWTAVIRNLATFAKLAVVTQQNMSRPATFAAKYAAEEKVKTWYQALGIALMDLDGERSYVPDMAVKLGKEFLTENWDSFRV